MSELRYHPLIDDWVMVDSNRQNRPQMPSGCPFCPGSGKVPEGYTIHRYANDFPILSATPPVPDPVATGFFDTRPAYGRCEVILYSPNHTDTFSDLSNAHMAALVDAWAGCFKDMAADPQIKYVFIFENRGEAVGTTMPHPHGQVYGIPVLPKKIQLELDASRKHRRTHDDCLFCALLREEQAAETRIVFTNPFFTVFLPFFTEYPYGIYVMANRHVPSIDNLTPEERFSLGVTLKQTSQMFDALFGIPFPTMMCMHNAPVNSDVNPEEWHFHIEFFPPMRSADKLKYNASSETGIWFHCNPTSPEEKALELRAAYQRIYENPPVKEK